MRRVEAFDPIEAAIQRFIATALNEFRGELQVFRAEILAEIRRLDARIDGLDRRMDGPERELRVAIDVRERLAALEARRA